MLGKPCLSNFRSPEICCEKRPVTKFFFKLFGLNATKIDTIELVRKLCMLQYHFQIYLIE